MSGGVRRRGAADAAASAEATARAAALVTPATTSAMTDSDVLSLVLRALDPDTLLSVATVCKGWNRRIGQCPVWRSIFTAPFRTHLCAAVAACDTAARTAELDAIEATLQQHVVVGRDDPDAQTARARVREARAATPPSMAVRCYAYDHWHVTVREWLCAQSLPVDSTWAPVAHRLGAGQGILSTRLYVGHGFDVAWHCAAPLPEWVPGAAPPGAALTGTHTDPPQWWQLWRLWPPPKAAVALPAHVGCDRVAVPKRTAAAAAAAAAAAPDDAQDAVTPDSRGPPPALPDTDPTHTQTLWSPAFAYAQLHARWHRVARADVELRHALPHDVLRAVADLSADDPYHDLGFGDRDADRERAGYTDRYGYRRVEPLPPQRGHTAPPQLPVTYAPRVTDSEWQSALSRHVSSAQCRQLFVRMRAQLHAVVAQDVRRRIDVARHRALQAVDRLRSAQSDRPAVRAMWLSGALVCVWLALLAQWLDARASAPVAPTATTTTTTTTAAHAVWLCVPPLLVCAVWLWYHVRTWAYRVGACQVVRHAVVPAYRARSGNDDDDDDDAPLPRLLRDRAHLRTLDVLVHGATEALRHGLVGALVFGFACAAVAVLLTATDDTSAWVAMARAGVVWPFVAVWTSACAGVVFLRLAAIWCDAHGRHMAWASQALAHELRTALPVVVLVCAGVTAWLVAVASKAAPLLLLLSTGGGGGDGLAPGPPYTPAMWIPYVLRGHVSWWVTFVPVWIVAVLAGGAAALGVAWELCARDSSSSLFGGIPALPLVCGVVLGAFDAVALHTLALRADGVDAPVRGDVWDVAQSWGSLRGQSYAVVVAPLCVTLAWVLWVGREAVWPLWPAPDSRSGADRDAEERCRHG